MQNKAYHKYIFNDLMREDRVKSGISQSAFGSMIGRTQQQISELENGIQNPTPELMIQWFTVVKAFEHIDLVQYMCELHPLAAAPVDSELDQCSGDALINLEIQMEEAYKAISSIRKYINHLRPGKISVVTLSDWQQVYDLYPAIRSFLYSGVREYGLDLAEVTTRWTQKARSNRVAMVYDPKSRVEVYG